MSSATIVISPPSGVTFDYYISPTGSDSNPGTLALPWAITALQNTNAHNAAIAGKRIGLLPGTYDIHTLASGSSPTDYTYPVLDIPSGTSGTPTYIGSSDNSGYYSPRAATIYNVGGQSTNAALGQRPTGTGNFTIDGIVLNHTGVSCSGLYVNYGGSPGYGPGTVTGVTIKNCEMFGMAGVISGNNYALIAIQNTLGAVITGNRLHDYSGWDSIHIHAILEYGCTNSQFTFNTMYNGPTGTHSKTGCSGTVVSYNYFYNLSFCAVQGLDGALGNSNSGNAYSVHHNIVDNCVRLGATDVNTTRYQSQSWFNNTIYDPSISGISGISLPMGGSATCQFYNNILYTPNATSGWSSGGAWGSSPGGFTIFDYNCYFASAYATYWGFYYGTVYSSLAAWQTATGSPDAHSFTSNPSFVSSITSGAGPIQFNLNGGSPCNGTGQGGATMGAWDGSASTIGCGF